MKRAALLHAVLALSCSDPLREQTLDELGEETPGVPAGPLHRPGQPCAACHGGQGPAEGEFSLSGTVYQAPADPAPLAGATIRIIDGTGAQSFTVSNCSGNFFFRTSEFVPSWPVWVKLEVNGHVAEMRSAISRERSCATCHRDPASASSVGHVYFGADGGPVGDRCD